MPIPKEYRDICEMLSKATADKRVTWIVDGTTYALHLPDFSFELWGGTDEQSNEFVAVGLREPESRTTVDNWFVEESDQDFPMMRDLYASVRRQTGNVSQKLQALRELLKTGQNIGTADLLTIESAQYGAQGKWSEVADILRRRIAAGRIDNFRVNNESMGGDPLPGVVKVLTVKYSYMGKSHSASFTENEVISLPEPSKNPPDLL